MLKIGWAEESLLPEKTSLSGQFFEIISEYLESEISAPAMAIEADGEAADVKNGTVTIQFFSRRT